MIDPVTALGVATTAFNAIKTGFQAGRDVEGMAAIYPDGWVQSVTSRSRD